MNPFDMPPSSPPVWSEPAPEPPAPQPRRGRMVVGVFAVAGVIGAAAFGVSQLASAEDDVAPATSPATTTVDSDEPDEPQDKPDDEQDRPDEPQDRPDGTEGGELRIDVGDGEPIVIDLDELDAEQIEELHECLGVPHIAVPGFPFGDDDMPPRFEEFFERFGSEDFQRQMEDMLGELEPGDLPFDPEEFQRRLEEVLGEMEPGDLPFDLDEFQREIERPEGGTRGSLGPLGPRGPREPGRGPFGGFMSGNGQVTVLGPDGLTIIDLGDGDGAVTITRDGDTGEITVETDGTASESDLSGMFGAAPDREQVEACVADLD